MEMEKKTVRQLIHKAVEDMVQWVRESPTEEVRQYRIGLVMSAVNGTMEPQGNEEWDMCEESRRRESRANGTN